MDPALFEIVIGEGPIVATAIHNGHEVRSKCAAAMCVDEAARLREEDPFTARFAAVAPTRLVAKRSRFEVDLNRPRDRAIYTSAEEAWGLDVWRKEPGSRLIEDSLAEYDAFYTELERVLRDRIARHGKVVVLDCHSYNHCFDGPGCAADPAENPEINLGTGSVPPTWRPLVDRFRTDLAAQGFDVRENVKFHGGEMTQWIHRTFPTTAVALALEFKKTFMDEWTSVADADHIDRIVRGLTATLPGLVEMLGT